MSYIIMGIDECGTEFRPSSEVYTTETLANEAISEVRERYPEARSVWVELHKEHRLWRIE